MSEKLERMRDAGVCVCVCSSFQQGRKLVINQSVSYYVVLSNRCQSNFYSRQNSIMNVMDLLRVI